MRCTSERTSVHIETKKVSNKQQIRDMRKEIQVEQTKSKVLVPSVEGTLGVTSVSLRRFAYDARSRCHSHNVLR